MDFGGIYGFLKSIFRSWGIFNIVKDYFLFVIGEIFCF